MASKQGKEKNTNIIAQAGVLAAAGIISRIIGLLYRSPLSSVIGDLGLGYYSEAYAYYLIILMISTYSIPSAVSKLISQKLAQEEYRNAHRYFKAALTYALVLGAICGTFLFFGAGLFVEEAAVPVLRIFAPTIFIYSILGVLRGYSQAHRSMVATSVSQIVEQIVNAAVSIGAAYLFIRLAFGTMTVPSDTQGMVLRAIKGASGSALGTGCGVTAGAIFMVWQYRKSRKAIFERIDSDKHEIIESYGRILKAIIAIVTPFIISTAIYNVSSTVNTKLYTDIYPVLRNRDMVDITSRWGIFSGKSLTIANIPIAFSTAMALAMLPSVSSLVAVGKRAEARDKIGLSVRATMMISIPCAVGIFALAKPVIYLLFPSGEESLNIGAKCLMALAPSVVFYALSTLNNSILQGIGKVKTPIVNAAIALCVQTIAGILMLRFTNLDLYAMAIVNSLYSFLMAVLNQYATRKAIGYKQEIKRAFVMPFLASAIMGIVAKGIYELLLREIGSMRISVIVAIIVAVPVYVLILIFIGGVTKQEIESMPRGNKIAGLLTKLKLLK